MALPIDVSSENFATVVVDSEVMVLAEFWAPWCGPCKAMRPVLDQIAKRHDGELQVVRINIEQEEELAERFAIASIPAMKLLSAGKVVSELMGARATPQVELWLSQQRE